MPELYSHSLENKVDSWPDDELIYPTGLNGRVAMGGEDDEGREHRGDVVVVNAWRARVL